MPQDLKLRSQTDAESIALIEPGLQNSIYYKRPFYAVSDFADEKLKAETQTATIPSGKIVAFEIEKVGTVLDDISLEFTIPALTVPGDGTYIRYQDYGLCHIRDFIDFSYASSRIHRLHRDELFSDYQFFDDEKKRIFEYLDKGNLSAATRNTLALNPQTIRIKLNTPWKGQGNQLPIVSLANKLRIQFELPDAREVIQTDGTKPLSINYSDVRLVYHVGHIPGRERISLANMSLRPDGINTLFTDVNVMKVNIPANALAGVNGYPIELRDFVGPIRHIRGIIRTTEQVDPLSANPQYYEFNPSYLDNLSYHIKANEKSLFELANTETDQVESTMKFYPCGPETNQFYVYWDYVHDDVHCSSGHINMSNFTGSKLYLKRPGAHPDLEITLLAYAWNWTSLKNGNYQRIWV